VLVYLSQHMTQAATLPRLQMSVADWGRLLLLGAIWGGSFFFARIAVSEMPPLVLVFWRVCIAAAALHLYLLIAGPSFRLALAHWRAIALLAVLNNVIPFSLIFLGQTQLGAGLASVLNATTPFWTLIIANAMTSDEKLSWNKVLGVVLGVAGTAIMIGPGLLSQLGAPAWAKFALVGASVSYAFALMVAKRLKSVPPPVLATGQLTASTVVMLPVALLAFGPAEMAGAGMPVWLAVIGLALLSTAFAYLLYFRLVSDAGATNASLVTLIVPVSAILLGTLFLGEHLEPIEVFGMVVIAAGLVTIDGRLLGSATKPFR
jgi:drug/metabolite transporter (DMT)-like permease